MPRGYVTKNVMQKISWEPLHDKVYISLRDALMEAQFKPGEQLSLRAVAGMLGVSVMPVRAAVLRLVAEKAVVQAANGTFVVPELAQKEFDEIFFLRANLEGLAAELAASRCSKKWARELQSIAAKLTRVAQANDPVSYLRINREFKFAVVQAADAPVLLDLVQSLWMRVGPFMSRYAEDLPSQISIDYHDDIVSAIVSGDGAAARKAMERDIEDGVAYLRQVADFKQN